ncbi:MAG: PD-(D/E)XK nuclease family protein [Bacteroidales bacterium]|nr:PD-(D/E)XK nuclease family protein [Bacteroidales bacterium]
MNPFLRQVAAHYFEGPGIERTCFVFPNRRSMVFFKKYLGALVREKPLLAPPMYTINDFFYRVHRVNPTEKLRLQLELYQCYKALNPQAEPLDEFVFWGDVLLADFDDVDKYMVDAEGLFRNVSEFKSIQDNYDYISDAQREAINHFLQHFRDGKMQLDRSGVQARFVQLWNILLPLYKDFGKALRSKDMAYEGMVYRALAQRLREGASVKDILEPVFPETERFVFVGLNALNECERVLLRRMRDAGLAQFVWDYVSPQIRDAANKSSVFMEQNIKEFPQAFPIDPEGLPTPEVTVVSVPSGVGQAKLAPWILSQTSGDPVETAFVLPDQDLLLPLLNSIPPEQDSVNVTMGYPMSGSAVYTLLDALGRMQLRLRLRQEQWYFYHAPVREVFSSGLFRELLSEEEAAIVDTVKKGAQYYIPMKELQGGPVLDLLFRPVIRQAGEASALQNHEVERYFSEVVALIGRTLAAKGDMLLELDFAKRAHTELNILQDMDLEVLPATHLKLLERLFQGISVPFRGEPLKGLQVMGPLETRALDFRYLVVLSAGEGMFPRRSVSASFIPPELRKGFGLPTYEFQDAVWAYYFYRMIQRPEHVWLVFDSRTEGLRGGEESRYIKQLAYHFGLPMERISAIAPIQTPVSQDSIPKTQEQVDKVRGGLLSTSSLQSYLDCPAKFYFQVVEGLKAPQEVAESLDARMLGNVFHAVMKELYDRKSPVCSADITAWRKDVSGLKKLIRAQVLEEMHTIEVTGRNLVLEEVILDYVQAALKHDLALLTDSGSAGFQVLGLEQHCFAGFEGFRLHGYIDRMDSYRDGVVRIVDYKTGRVEDNEIQITDENAAQVADQLFGPKNTDRPKIALQLFVYDLLAHEYPKSRGKALVNAIYSTARLYTGALPEVPESPVFTRLVKERLSGLLKEITDVSTPWTRTTEPKTCAWCDFKDICGR